MSIEAYLSYLPFLAVGVTLVGVVIVVLFSRKRERERREALIELSHRAGFDFAEKDDSLPPPALARSYLFDQGRARRVSNVLRRADGGVEMVYFDYQYTTGGKNSTTYRQSVVALGLSDQTLPAFQLRPEHLFHKIGSALGFPDIDFVDSPEFSKRYLLKASDEESIRRLFSPSVRGWFEQATPPWSVEGAGSWVVFYRHGKRVKVPDVAAFLEECRSARRALLGD